jgi:hypothetical protein
MTLRCLIAQHSRLAFVLFFSILLRGDLEYFRSGADIHITAVHIFGWATADGNVGHACGDCRMNAQHLTINGTEFSSSLVFQASAVPQGWMTSSWVATFLGPEYPASHTGGSVTITAYAAFDGGHCYLVPSRPRSLVRLRCRRVMEEHERRGLRAPACRARWPDNAAFCAIA